MGKSSLESYEAFKNEQVQAFANVLVSFQYGCNPKDIFNNIVGNPFMMGEFMSDLYKEAERENTSGSELIGLLSTEDQTLIDTQKLFDLLVAYMYASENKLIALKEELMPKEAQEFIEKLKKAERPK
ncbi:hypothetical protein HB670_27310 [Bacillus cereus]|uniref:hypothetical protein n=1 Tax=Bacillus cereus TaxID=1396 RepID=UPI001443D1A7|nr:hypothetical protein [Bacillus cereus]NKX03298.1 hypothetical protein [Bacillus cereus]